MEQELTEFAEFYESTREDCLRIGICQPE